MSNPEKFLDAQGLICPEPVMMLHNVMREMSVGDVVKVMATDPSTQRDIPKFCQFLGHTLMDQRTEQADTLFIYWIRKADKN